MIEFEGVVLMPTATIPSDAMAAIAAPGDGAWLGGDGAILTTGSNDDAVLLEDPGSSGDEWIGTMFSTTSTEALATGLFSLGDEDLIDRQGAEEEEEIVVTGRRYTDDRWEWDGGNGGSNEGYSGYGGGGGGGDGGSGSLASPVAPHTQDCGTEDGAAVQVAKHVKGDLAAGVSGPPNPLTTSSGNDWTKVEFGAIIIQNPDGSYGALNDTIYSNDHPTAVNIVFSAGPAVQGFWHSHPYGANADQRMIENYPSPYDWQQLAGMAGKLGVVANPSAWIMGSDGVTREFKLSERAYVEGLSDNQKKNGEGLDGRQRSQSCG